MHLYCTLDVHCLPVSVLTVCTARKQCTCKSTYSVHYTCSVLHGHSLCKCCAFLCTTLTDWGSKWAAGARSARAVCTASAPCRPSMNHCAKIAKFVKIISRIQQFFCTAVRQMAYCCAAKLSRRAICHAHHLEHV